MILETKRLLLRPVEEADLDAMFVLHRQPHVGPHAGWRPHRSPKETAVLLKELFLNRPSSFGIVWKTSGHLIGQICLMEDPKRENPDAGMLDYGLREDFWNLGIVTEAAQAVIDYGFRLRHLMLISAYCYPENYASRRVLEKCGFHHEGTLALCECRYDSRIFDNECYSIRASEWKRQ